MSEINVYDLDPQEYALQMWGGSTGRKESFAKADKEAMAIVNEFVSRGYTLFIMRRALADYYLLCLPQESLFKLVEVIKS